jgi:hypothetical protein
MSCRPSPKLVVSFPSSFLSLFFDSFKKLLDFVENKIKKPGRKRDATICLSPFILFRFYSRTRNQKPRKREETRKKGETLHLFRLCDAGHTYVHRRKRFALALAFYIIKNPPNRNPRRVSRLSSGPFFLFKNLALKTK